PLIQVSGRGKRNDKFWFTIFHEIGHVLLHGKKKCSLKNFDYSGCDIQKEQEADDFAKKWTFTEEQEKELLENPVTKENIIDYANRHNIHPAFIVGRLQHEEIIKFSVFNELTESLAFENFLVSTFSLGSKRRNNR
ncbi:MAG: ImmA/IrrE family metallo-endopeptidase, partial [Chloroflexia bacterium]|nr:ImmA/IrrE family metallo-endopeptidase [Chloroflexia bacterium]